MRELQALVAPKPPQEVLVRGHPGLAIDELLGVTQDTAASVGEHAWRQSWYFFYGIDKGLSL